MKSQVTADPLPADDESPTFLFCFFFLGHQTAALEVVIPPDISNEEGGGELLIPEGGSAKLSCKARGVPHPRVTWRREDGQEFVIRNSNGVQKTKGTSYVFFICVTDGIVQSSRVDVIGPTDGFVSWRQQFTRAKCCPFTKSRAPRWAPICASRPTVCRRRSVVELWSTSTVSYGPVRLCQRD